MNIVNVFTFKSICGVKADEENIKSVLESLKQFGEEEGLDEPHRFGHYCSQLSHESGRFRYDREVWGPTAAQRRYEDRSDLGHSPSISGEAFKFRGRSGIQLTGRYNYSKFTQWVWENISNQAPDFEIEPDLINTDPWEGLVPIWYWSYGNPISKSLNIYADRNDIEMLTKRINGGLNGYQDRINLYVRTGLVLLDYEMKRGVIADFQKDNGLLIDDVAGVKTRKKIHEHLLEASKLEFLAVNNIYVPPVVDEPISNDEDIVEEEPVKKDYGKGLIGLFGAILFGLGLAFEEIWSYISYWVDLM